MALERHENRPRIALGITSFRSFKLLEGFGDYLSTQGWEVHLISSPRASTLQSVSKNITLHEVDMAREPSPYRDIKALVEWVRVLNKIKPDVVSAGTPKAGLLGMVAAYLTRVPRRTYHLRGLRLETESGLRFSTLRLLEKIAGAASTDVLAISPSLRERAVSLGLVSASKIKTVGKGSSNGVDVKVFRPEEAKDGEIADLRESLGLINNVPVVGFTGRVTRDKGVFELAEASRSLHKRGVMHQLLVIGPMELGKQENPWEAAGLEGKQAPIIIDRVDNIWNYYRAMDILALPTYREGMGNVLLEASACGIPTVTTRATGARDAVLDCETGFHVSVGDSEGLANALEMLLENPELRQTMGKKGVEYVRRNFDRGKVWRDLAQYYEGTD